MQPIIDWLIDNFYALWPLWRVEFWETALRVRGGIDRDILAPGLRWRWPLFDEIEREPTTVQTINLPACSITTADAVAVTASGNVRFRVVDIRLYWRSIHDGHDVLSNILMGRLARSICDNDFGMLHDQWDELHDEVLANLQDAVGCYGVKVEAVDLTDFVPCRQYRLFLDHG